jgi:hypothetical protein
MYRDVGRAGDPICVTDEGFGAHSELLGRCDQDGSDSGKFTRSDVASDAGGDGSLMSVSFRQKGGSRDFR